MLKFRFPHALSIITALIIIMAISTYFLPSGKFDRKFDEKVNREIVVNGTYKAVESNPQGYSSVLTSFIKGMQDASEVIAYVLIVGGAYGIIMSTGALNKGLSVLISKMGNKIMLLIPTLMFLFALGGTTTGMWEETLAFYTIIVSLMVLAGFDALVGVAVVILGAGSGVLASTVNPFATGIASQISEIPLKDGIIWRVIAWFVIVSASTLYVLWYANKVKKDPAKSLLSEAQRQEQTKHYLSAVSNFSSSGVKFEIKDFLVVAGFLINIVAMIYGVINWGWYIAELSMSFLTLATFSAIVFRLDQYKLWNSFIEGASGMMSAALVIGFARAIVIVADQGNIIDTILYGIANVLSGISSWAFIIVNQIFQLFIAVFVPSSSGHAALTMSIMAPLADLFHIHRSSVVTAMQFASGMANLFTPTAGVLMAGIAVGKITYGTWLRFVLPILVIHFIITSIILVMSVYL